MLLVIKTKGKKSFALDVLYFLAGSTIYAVCINGFTAPNQIAPGGITGLSTVFNHLLGTPIGMMIFVINLPIFLWAIVELGYKTVVKTIAATFITSFMIDFLAPYIPVYEGNKMLAAIFGGVLEGFSLSLVFLRGATTGGTDMIARLLGRRLRHLSMGRLMLCVDGVIIVISGFAFQSIESAMYAFIAVFVSTRFIDAILYGTDSGNGKMLFIMSEKNNEIACQILTDLERGVTALNSRGVYSNRSGEVLLCAVRRYEVHRVYDIVHSLDENAFMIVGEAGEISGEGFRELKPDEKTLRELLKKRKQNKDQK